MAATKQQININRWFSQLMTSQRLTQRSNVTTIHEVNSIFSINSSHQSPYDNADFSPSDHHSQSQSLSIDRHNKAPHNRDNTMASYGLWHFDRLRPHGSPCWNHSPQSNVVGTLSPSQHLHKRCVNDTRVWLTVSVVDLNSTLFSWLCNWCFLFLWIFILFLFSSFLMMWDNATTCKRLAPPKSFAFYLIVVITVIIVSTIIIAIIRHFLRRSLGLPHFLCSQKESYELFWRTDHRSYWFSAPISWL